MSSQNSSNNWAFFKSFSGSYSSATAEAVQDAGADATADAADAGGYQGQHYKDQDHPHPPARSTFTLIQCEQNKAVGQ